MSSYLASLLAMLIFFTSALATPTSAQEEDANDTLRQKNPYRRELEERGEIQDSADEATATQNAIDYNASILTTQADQLEATFGTLDAEGNYIPGALRVLKLRPSDKKRLTRIANGSLTSRQKRSIIYDQRALDLIIQLATPTELGGGGLEHLRIDDFLRFRSGQRSTETEGSDNISAHPNGRAIDITEINKTQCYEVSMGLFGIGGDKKPLPPFPVKVIWQGGAPYNPSASSLGSFDSALHQIAFQGIVGSLAANSFSEGNTDLLQKLQLVQRRALAEELGFKRQSLDEVINNDLLETLGRAALNHQLNLAPGALQGSNKDELLRSIPRSYFEDALGLPVGSFKGDSVNDGLENLGRTIIAYQNNLRPGDLAPGKTDIAGKLTRYSRYTQTESAFDLPAGSLNGIRANNAAAFRMVGAQYLARKLRYAPNELQELVNLARNNQPIQLSLARYGDLVGIPLASILPIIAPAQGSSKAAGERALAALLLDAQGGRDTNTLEPALLNELKRQFPGIQNSASMESVLSRLTGDSASATSYRLIGAVQIEEAFDLPDGSFVTLIQKGQPSLQAYGKIVGPLELEAELAGTLTDQEASRIAQAQPNNLQTHDLRYYFNRKQYPEVIDSHLNLPAGTTAQFYQGQLNRAAYEDKVGQAFISITIVDNWHILYPTPTAGIAQVKPEALFNVLLGKIDSTNTIAGASWIEEDRGLVPDSFASIVTDKGSGEERLVNAGVVVLAGHLYEAYNIDGTGINDLSALTNRIGQARVETTLGLKPGSFTSLTGARQANDFFDFRFASPGSVDAIFGLRSGSTQQLLNGGSITSFINEVGKVELDKIDVTTLHTRFGWDERFILYQQQNTSSGSGSATKPKLLSELTTAELRQLLAKIGGYNLDYSFGYDPGTFAQWLGAGSEADRDAIFLGQGSKQLGASLGLNASQSDQLLNHYRSGSGTNQSLMNAISQNLGIPSTDAASFLNGDITQAGASLAAARRARDLNLDLGGNTYETLRMALLGWSNNTGFMNQLSQAEIANYNEILRLDYETLKNTNPGLAESLLDQQFLAITRGSVAGNGNFNSLLSPYPDSLNNQIKAGYFANRGARSQLLYSLLDSAITKQTPGLPRGFAQGLLDGSRRNRASMLFAFLNAKQGDGILESLPGDLRPSVTSWLRSRDGNQALSFANDARFTGWASQVLSQYSDNEFSPGGVKLALQSLGNQGTISEIPTDSFGFERSDMAGLINKQLGLSSGTFGTYYDNYNQVQRLYGEYKAGNLDQSQALFAADAMFLDGKLAGFTNGVDNALGLPPGSTQLIVSYYMTGNPYYLALFAQNIFFGSRIECPDLQQEAQKNIKKLIEAVVDQGQQSARLIPSQIISLKPEYVQALNETIQRNYFPCFESETARCGLFARPEYAKQVHIGF